VGTAVQWLRSRFNECVDKAEFAKSRCGDEIPESARSAERLVYDRALEMVCGCGDPLYTCAVFFDWRSFSLQSRSAAVNELKGESGVECEAAYETALWMLHALVDVTMQDTEQVDEDDRVTVDKCK
jgi:serine/threonine-protein kinase ULK/ATG1